MKVMVLGAGTMGSGIAQVFAQAGHDVVLRDLEMSRVEAGLKAVARNLGRAVAKGALTEEAKAEILGRIAPATELQAGADAALVVEAAVEDMAMMERPFSRLVTRTSDGICSVRWAAVNSLVSNTSPLAVRLPLKPGPYHEATPVSVCSYFSSGT